MPTPDAPNRIIESGYSTLGTPSLLQAGNEPVPAEIMRDLLDQEWAVHDTLRPRPAFYVKDDKGDPGQVDLARSDVIVVTVEEVAEQQRGYKYEFKDVEVPLVLEIYSRQDRQRVYNLVAECRRIVYRWQRAMNPYQQMYWDRFVDESEGRLRNWKISAYVRLTSLAVPVFSGVVEGMVSPDVDPSVGSFPDADPGQEPRS